MRKWPLLLLTLCLVFVSGLPVSADVGDNPAPGGLAYCNDGWMQPDLFVNDRMVCDLQPRPYLKNDRTMYALRPLADALSQNGNAVSVDYFRVPNEHGRVTEYVTVMNRHRELLFEIGSRRVRVWRTEPQTGVTVETERFYMDVAPEIVDGRTRLPLRYVVEGLGGMVDGWNPYLRVTHVDPPSAYDYRMAEGATPGASHAYLKGLITRPELDFLTDYGVFWEDGVEAGVSSVPLANPVAWIRWQVISRIVATGHRPTDADYRAVATATTTGLGQAVPPEEIQRIGQVGESNMRTAARLIPGLEESGTDPATGRTVDFGPYNRLKAANPNWNGPDGVFVVRNDIGIIQYIVVAESKATGRPWVSPSRFEENPPLQDQLANLQRWSDPTVRQMASDLNRMLAEAQRLLDAGEITQAQYHERVQVINMDFATSRSGGISKGYAALREAAGKSYAGMDMKGTITRLFVAWDKDGD